MMGFSRTSLKNLIRLPESLQVGSLANEAVNRIHALYGFVCWIVLTVSPTWNFGTVKKTWIL